MSQKYFIPNIIWEKPHPNLPRDGRPNNGEGVKSLSPHCWGDRRTERDLESGVGTT